MIPICVIIVDIWLLIPTRLANFRPDRYRKAPLQKISSKQRPPYARKHYRHERYTIITRGNRYVPRAIARSIGAGRDGGSARIAVCCPSGHVQTDSSSPFTGDLLLARTCNQGEDCRHLPAICWQRPSGGPAIAAPAALLRASSPSHPPRNRIRGKVHERV